MSYNMPMLDDRRTYFDTYWQRQPVDVADPRAVQRAGIIYRLLEGKRGKMLDAGCGRGLALDYFAERDYDVTGADISPDAVRLVEQKGHRGFVLDLERETIDGKYNIVLCLEVLQQLFDPEKVLRKLFEVVADDGLLVVSLPNEFHIVSRLRILLGISHLGHFEHSHLHLFSPARNRELLSDPEYVIASQKHIPIIPPRLKILSALFMPLVQWLPSLFALSSIYLVRKK
ncbi:Methyltransferase type 12 [Candidatus Zixiibacteriota bacterium]|nr:Methyltransferase type 12 [candidate division Zixibacteria bacterium]